jgi:hypothetical protein
MELAKMAANTQRKQLRLRASIDKGNSGKSSKGPPWGQDQYFYQQRGLRSLLHQD